MPSPRNSAGQFLPGHSGNPVGRTKESLSVSKLAREHTVEALNTLVKIMNDKKAPPASRVLAASNILDRGHGKAPQTINVRQLEDMTPEELTDELNAILDGLDPSVADFIRNAAADIGSGGERELH